MSKYYVSLAIISLIILVQTSFSQALKGSLVPKKGLWVSSGSLQWGMGSEINFLNADRKHHEYYFTWWEQDADTTNKEKDILIIGSQNTAVDGTLSLDKSKKQITLKLNSTWNKSTDGVCDILYLKIWLPFFKEATWFDKNGYEIKQSLDNFEDSVIIAKTPFGEFKFSAATSYRIRKDDHPSLKETDYTSRSQYLYFEEKNIPIKKGEQLSRTFWIEQIGESNLLLSAKKDTIISTELNRDENAWQPITGKLELLPQPTSWKKSAKEHIVSTTPDKPSDPLQLLFNEIVKKYWKQEAYFNPSIIAKEDTSLPNEGYRLGIDQSIKINYGSPAALQYAMETVGQLAFQKNGMLLLPYAEIEDAPKTSWRGIHMFTGPISWMLHKRMFENVLLPLKINKAVIQCEQSKWNSFPSVHNSISIGLSDLKEEFTFLRNKNVEPIPLIQSIGHMEWFFKPIENRELATNPSYPYTLNVFNTTATKAIKKIWDEAINLLEPKTIHVGFDEIGMIGFNWPREKEIELFKKQINWLSNYSKKRNLSLMIWGDMGLAPGEGPDACNGITPSRALEIRNSIPKNTWVADWHYIGNADPNTYKKNLSIWKESGLRPIASPWFIGENIRGFTLAAIEQQAGVLQTTWADFESSEPNLLKNIEQFGAYVLALDYAWSGRSEMPKNLPYDPILEFTARFYRQSLPLQSLKGWSWTGNSQLFNTCDNNSITRPSNFIIKAEKEQLISGLKLSLATSLILPEATPTATLQLLRNNKVIYEITMLYGREMRATEDPRPIFKRVSEKGKTEWYLFLQTPQQIDQIVIKSLHPAAGITIKEVKWID
jgi:hypothetical protein